MKRGIVVVGLIFLAAALVFLNQGLKKSAVSDHDEDEQAQKTQQTQKAQKPLSTPGDPKAVLPPEETLGNTASAKHHIEVGWVYDEANQQKPETLTIPIQAIRDYVRRSGTSVSAEIVNQDIPMEDRSPAAQAVTGLGIRVDGRSLYGGNLSEVPIQEGMIIEQLNRATK